LSDGIGTFEVVTTKAGVLNLRGLLSPSFVLANATLVRFARLPSPTAPGVRLALHVHEVRERFPAEISLDLPSFAEACGDKEDLCLFGLEIRNSILPPDPDLGLAGDFNCPGQLEETGGLVAACFPGIDASLSHPVPAGQRAEYHTIRYVKKCNATGVREEPYEDPGSPICSESIQSAQKCAFGLADTCRPCPKGAICPGGDEARSFPGFYTVDVTRGIVEPCIPPAETRCAGWNPQALATLCGKAYTGVQSLRVRWLVRRCETRASARRSDVRSVRPRLLLTARPSLRGMS
jgi:hypothetical protein